MPAITAKASSGPAIGAPPPTITAANSCSASSGDRSAGAAIPISSVNPAPPAAPNAAASASSETMRCVIGTPSSRGHLAVLADRDRVAADRPAPDAAP